MQVARYKGRVILTRFVAHISDQHQPLKTNTPLKAVSPWQTPTNITDTINNLKTKIKLQDSIQFYFSDPFNVTTKKADRQTPRHL